MENTYVKPLQTLMDVYKSLPEGTRAQLIQNQLIMSPAPLDAHQVATGEIYAALLYHVKKNKLGEVRIAPYDVYLDSNNAFQPDITFMANENLYRIQPTGLHGAPDLVVEVLSPGTQRYDRGKKKTVYERNGVKEYWIVDPITKTSEGFWLMNGEYEPQLSEEGKIFFRLLEFTVAF